MVKHISSLNLARTASKIDLISYVISDFAQKDHLRSWLSYCIFIESNATVRINPRRSEDVLFRVVTIATFANIVSHYPEIITRTCIRVYSIAMSRMVPCFSPLSTACVDARNVSVSRIFTAVVKLTKVTIIINNICFIFLETKGID